MVKNEGFECSPLHPGWIRKNIFSDFLDEEFKVLILFYVINTPCSELSSSSIKLTEYGWSKDVWKNNALKNELFSIAGLRRNETFVVAKKPSDMKTACEKTRLKKGFHKDRTSERIALYKRKCNELESICYHIRNALHMVDFKYMPMENK